MSRISFILLSLVFVWLLQLCFSFLQIKRFNARIVELRKQGSKTAVGMVGNTYKRRAYGVIVVNEDMRIVAAEQFSGWTVFAQLKPAPSLVGMPLSEIDAEPKFSIKPKTWQAFRNAAHYINEYEEGAETSSIHAPTKKERGKIALPTGWRVASKSKEKE